MGFGIGSSTWPVMGLMLGQAGEKSECTLANYFIVLVLSYDTMNVNTRRLHDIVDTWFCWALTMVWRICIPLCQSLHLLSTESHPSPLPEVLELPGVLLHFHTPCTSTGCPLRDDSRCTVSMFSCSLLLKLSQSCPHPMFLLLPVTASLPLSLQRTNRNSAAACFTLMSTCVIRRTSLFLVVVPISGLFFTSFSGGST